MKQVKISQAERERERERAERKCDVCKGQIPLNRHGNFKACSDKCSKERIRLWWKKQYSNKRKAQQGSYYQLEYYYKIRSPHLNSNEWKCVNCDKSFTRTSGSIKTCSIECARQRRNLALRRAQQKQTQRLKELKQLNSKSDTKMNCVICDKEFEKRGSKKTCSLECRLINNRLSTRRADKNYKEQKKLNKTNDNVVLAIHCLICKKLFPKKGTALVCSQDCRKEKWKQDYFKRSYVICKYCQKQIKRKSIAQKKCGSSECKLKYAAENARKYRLVNNLIRCRNCKRRFRKITNSLFCSDDCLIKYKPLTKVCANCQKVFVLHRKSSVLNCSSKCKKEYKRRTNSQRWYQRKKSEVKIQGSTVFFPCIICGKYFPRTKPKSYPKMCSPECRKKNRAEKWRKQKLNPLSKLTYKFGNCVICQKSFKKRGKQKTCSEKHRREAEILWRKEYFE